MAYAAILMIAIALPIVSCDVSWGLSEDAINNADFELEKTFAINELKERLMQGLGLTQIPVSSGSSVKLSDAVIKLLLAQDHPPVQAQKQLARLLVPPRNDDFQCKRYNSSTSCRRFEYSIAPDVVYNKTEFWFYKIESLSSESPSISVLCSDSEYYEGEEQVIEHDTLVEEDGENKWVTLRLPMLKQLALWEGNLTCAIEVRGMTVDEVKPNVPLLIMMQDLDTHRRIKRSEDRVERSDACKTVSFNVSFEDIGFGDFIIYPLIYEARLCRGYCHNSQNMHETVVEHTFQINSSLEKEHGRCWSTCCRPKTYAPLLLVHSDKKKGSEISIESYFQDMIVTSCWCK